MTAPERIWAQAEHEDEGGYGSFWSAYKTDVPATEYRRADLYTAQQETIAALVEVIERNWMGDHWRGVSHHDAAEVDAALARAKEQA